MILRWRDDDSYLTCQKNNDGSIMLFKTLKEADKYANDHPKTNDMRVISIEAVKE
ncbi:hypothetical protein KKC91_11025 [bacterium]|nr:hypothetical protein [bacterium]